MAIALVGETNSSAATTNTAQTTTRTTTAGNCLVAAIHMTTGSSVSVSTVTDTAGNTWTKAVSAFQASVNSRVEYWYVLNASAVTSVTANLSGSTRSRVCIQEWSGVATVAALDVSAGAGSAATTTPAAVTVTTTNAGDVVIGGITYATTTGPTLASPFTLISSGLLTTVWGADAYYLPGAVGTYGATWTLPSSVGSGAATIALLPAATGGGAATATGAVSVTGTATAAAAATAAGSVSVGGAVNSAYLVSESEFHTASANPIPCSPVTATVGDYLVAMIHLRTGAIANTTTLTDSAGNTWTQQASNVTSGANTRILAFTAPITAALVGGTVTINTTAAYAATTHISRWTGISAVGQANSGAQAATTTPTAVTVTAGPGDAVVGGISYASATAPTSVAAPFTQLVGNSPNTGYYGANAYMLATTAGTYGPTWTTPSAASASTVVALTATNGGTAARTTASGSVSVAGTAGARAAAVVAGVLAVAATVAAGADATSQGTVTVTATANAGSAATSTAAGTISITGTTSAAARVTSAGVVSVTGSVTPAARATATGTVGFTGTATASSGASSTAAGTVTVVGTATARGSAATAGQFQITGSALPGAAVTTAGVLEVTATADTAAAASASGTVEVTGTATAHIGGPLRDIDVTLAAVTGSGWTVTAATSGWSVASVSGADWAVTSATT